jgi:serine phosphatase RsbU (regulator of sigma subunit)
LDDQCAFWRAGHNTLLHYRAATNDVREYQPVGMALGMTDAPVLDTHLEPLAFAFRTGDVLLLSSDGLTETHDPTGEQYGERRLLEAFGRIAGQTKTSSAIHDAIVADMEKFRGDSIEHDDITLVIIRKEGS